MRTRTPEALFAAVLVLAGCATSRLGSDAIVPAPAEAALAAGRAGMQPGEITRAADLYVIKCAKCHKFYDPAGYPDAEWRTWMTKMSKKSRIEEDEKDLLTRYLGASRRPSAAQGPAPQP